MPCGAVRFQRTTKGQTVRQKGKDGAFRPTPQRRTCAGMATQSAEARAVLRIRNVVFRTLLFACLASFKCSHPDTLDQLLPCRARSSRCHPGSRPGQPAGTCSNPEYFIGTQVIVVPCGPVTPARAVPCARVSFAAFGSTVDRQLTAQPC